jgi:prevent-host-death family protein
MDNVGIRELRQRASELVRRAQGGEVVTVSVNGRPAVRLMPIDHQIWHSFADIAELFEGPPDSAWESDRSRLDERLRDRFA